MEKTLKEKTTTALIWSFIDKFGQQMIYLVTGVVLARNLSPDDYGLVGELSIFIALSTIFITSGYARALLNSTKYSQIEYNTVFFYNVTSALFIYIILFFCAPLISLYFKQPSLTLISRVLFISLIFNSFVGVQSTYLTKNMNLKAFSRANIISLLVASIFAIVAAIKGMGVWALVIQTLLNSFCTIIFYWYYSEWRPTRHFDLKILKRFFPFSSKILLTNIITSVFSNINNVLIGRMYNNTQVGFYSNGSKYQDIPTGIITNTFRTILAPLLSKVNDDKDRFKRIVSKIIRTLSLFIFPVLLGLVLIAKPFFIVLIKEKWLPSVPIFQILCVSGIFVAINTILQEAILAKNRSKELMIQEIIKKGLLIILIIFTIKHGLSALAIGCTISSFLTLLLTINLSKRVIGYSFIDLLKDIFPYLSISFVLCTIAYFLSLPILNNYIFIGFCIGFVGILYILCCKIFKLEASNDMFIWIKTKIKLLNKKKATSNL
jgi:teichuronic acid exporter